MSSNLARTNRIAILRLPPKMTREEFLHKASPLPTRMSFLFSPADQSVDSNAISCAYFLMKTDEEASLLRDRFDGFVFCDSDGTKYPAVIEFLPSEDLPADTSLPKGLAMLVNATKK